MIVSRKRPNTGPLRAAVISNHIAPDVVTALRAQRGLNVDFFGVERQSVRVNGALLTKYDFVVSIGRTVLLSAACGVPCIMADIHGSDGLLTADKLDLARTVNFSGRLTKRAVTRVHLRDEIEKLHSYDREALRSAVIAEYSLSSRIEWLLSRYESLLTGSRARRHEPESTATLPSEGLVYADLTTQNRSLRAELQAARSEIASLRSKAARR